jgi:hypothetical protein
MLDTDGMATEEIDLLLIPQNRPSSTTLWIIEETLPASSPTQGGELSLLKYSGQAVARCVRIGDKKHDQFSLTSTNSSLPTFKTNTLLQFIPLFRELHLYEAEISLVSIRKVKPSIGE